MRQRKKNNARWWGLCALLLILSVTMALVPAFARYRTVLDPFEYLFKAKEPANVYLWGGKTDGGYVPLSGSWTVTEQGSELPILVTNGAGADYAAEDLTVTVRVAVTEGIQAGNNLTLTLKAGDETFAAVPFAIGENTAFYGDFGPGWIYRFFRSDGTEVTWELEGEELSELSASLTCVGVVPLDSSMAQIVVTATEN